MFYVLHTEFTLIFKFGFFVYLFHNTHFALVLQFDNEFDNSDLITMRSRLVSLSR